VARLLNLSRAARLVGMLDWHGARMAQLLTLSRAARLVGVQRGALQSKIRNGELVAFEGMVSVEDLQRAYPEAKLEDNAGLERFERIKDAAFARRVRERALPGAEVLVARLTELSRELARVQARSDAYRATLDQFRRTLRMSGGVAIPAATSAALLARLEQSLESTGLAEEPPALLVQDRFMRIMTAHVQIRPSGHEFFVEGGDTLLEAALRAGLSLDYGCSIGTCGKCKARIVAGQVQKTRHSDYALTAAEKNAGIALMCCNTAVTDLIIEAHEAHGATDMPRQEIEAKVKAVRALPGDVRLLHLQTPRVRRLRFLAGQSVSLALPGGPSTNFPVASCPCDDRNLQFHIRRRPGDAFTEQVFDGLKEADTVNVAGPQGQFVLDENSLRPLIFIAWESGFAPIKSLIEHAMALEAAETLDLYWITATETGRYFDNLCRAWSDALDNFRYVPLTRRGGDPDEAAAIEALEQVVARHAHPEAYDVYVAGPQLLIDAAQRLLPQRGLPRGQLILDTLEV
jgi:CDP-4-dehydro-6-deoxyglucose reductase